MPNIDIFGAGVSITVTCGGTTLDVCGIQMTTGDYYGNTFSFPRMTVRVNVGKVVNTANGKSQVTPAQFMNLVKWGPAKVTCTVKSVSGLKQPIGLPDGEHVIFSGAVVAVAMDQSASFDGGGSIAFNIEIEHNVASLLQGDLSTYPIFGAGPVAVSYTDAASKVSTAIRVAEEVGRTGDIRAITRRLFDLRANPPAGRRVSNAAGENIFNFSSSGTVLANFDAIDFKMNIDKVDSAIKSQFVTILLQSLLNDITYEVTYWHMLQSIVTSLDGWIIPTASGVQIRPMLPIPGSIDKKLTTKEYTKITFNRGRGSPMDLLVGGGAAYGSGAIGGVTYVAGEINALIGIYELPKSIRRSDMMLRYEFPPALNILATPAGKPVVPGAGELEMLKNNVIQSAAGPTAGIPNRKFVNEWLAFRCLQKAVASTGILVYTPLRFDIGIGHGIEVQLPSAGGGSVGSFVGIVSGLDILVDAETKTPICAYRVAGVLEKSAYTSAKSESKNAFASQVAAVAPWCA